MQTELKKSLSAAISQFNSKRSQLLQTAYQAGGEAAVEKLEEEYDALRDSYFKILQRELDENNHRYIQLTTVAKEEADNLTKSLKKLNNVNEIVDLTTSVINLVGRILIVLAI
ncbi:hypothetical protein ACEN2I_03430 [Flavobacterium sp. W22_SRS_FK3]|uniref:hypothetical protein n=1 Tax=Flavobacterium sp. W22_SRS_FK3 TaxID=3240275 RepID=UPI003F8F0920